MTTATEIGRKVNRVYRDVFLKRRYGDGSFDSSWIDITRFVSENGLQKIRYKLDSDDYDVGIFVVDNVDMTFINSSGKFNDPSDPRSLWAGLDTRHFSKVKIEAGYRDGTTGARIVEQAFEGVWDERSVAISQDDTLSATLLSRDFVLGSLAVTSGMVSSALLASEVIYILCARAEVTDFITVTEANINPANDVVIDDPSQFANRKTDAVLSEIMLMTNSVLYIDSTGNLIVRNRQHSPRPVWSFYLNSETGQRDNIFSLTGINSGRQRVKNYWQWSGTTLVASSAERHLQRYGVAKKSLSSSSVTTTATRQAILDELRDEWQFPKRELTLETDYLANEVALFDMVTLDIRPHLKSMTTRPLCGSSVCGTAECADYANGLRIEPGIAWKVLAIEHDLLQARTTLKLREKGNQLNDGYLPMVLSKTYSVTFTAETTKDIDTTAEQINAQYAGAWVLDAADDYADADIKISRPSSTTIRLTASVAITGTYRVLVMEAES